MIGVGGIDKCGFFSKVKAWVGCHAQLESDFESAMSSS